MWPENKLIALKEEITSIEDELRHNPNNMDLRLLRILLRLEASTLEKEL